MNMDATPPATNPLIQRVFRSRAVHAIAAVAMILPVTGFADDFMEGPRDWHHDGVHYHLVTTTAERLRVVWADGEGNPLRTFPAIHDHVVSTGETPRLIVNGGIFEPGGIPSGLLVQSGRPFRPLNTAQGRGNFYLQPNGVFLVTGEGAAVLATAEYARQPPRNVREAVQSGPLLLRAGRRHPAFNRESESRLHRNGVGVRRDGRVVLLMTDFHSDKHPNLWEFAGAFLELGCPDALFLDGDLCQMRTGESMRQPGNHMGSYIVLVEPDGAGTD